MLMIFVGIVTKTLHFNMLKMSGIKINPVGNTGIGVRTVIRNLLIKRIILEEKVTLIEEILILLLILRKKMIYN